MAGRRIFILVHCWTLLAASFALPHNLREDGLLIRNPRSYKGSSRSQGNGCRSLSNGGQECQQSYGYSDSPDTAPRDLSVLRTQLSDFDGNKNGCQTFPDGSYECRRGYSYSSTTHDWDTLNGDTLNQQLADLRSQIELTNSAVGSFDKNQNGCRTHPDGSWECKRSWGYGSSTDDVMSTSLVNQDLSQVSGGRGTPGRDKSGCRTFTDGSWECRRGYSYDASTAAWSVTPAPANARRSDTVRQETVYRNGEAFDTTQRGCRTYADGSWECKPEWGYRPSTDRTVVANARESTLESSSRTAGGFDKTQRGCRTYSDGSWECKPEWGYRATTDKTTSSVRRTDDVRDTTGSRGYVSRDYSSGEREQIRNNAGVANPNRVDDYNTPSRGVVSETRNQVNSETPRNCRTLSDGSTECRHGYSSSSRHERNYTSAVLNAPVGSVKPVLDINAVHDNHQERVPVNREDEYISRTSSTGDTSSTSLNAQSRVISPLSNSPSPRRNNQSPASNTQTQYSYTRDHSVVSNANSVRPSEDNSQRPQPITWPETTDDDDDDDNSQRPQTLTWPEEYVNENSPRRDALALTASAVVDDSSQRVQPISWPDTPSTTTERPHSNSGSIVNSRNTGRVFQQPKVSNTGYRYTQGQRQHVSVTDEAAGNTYRPSSHTRDNLEDLSSTAQESGRELPNEPTSRPSYGRPADRTPSVGSGRATYVRTQEQETVSHGSSLTPSLGINGGVSPQTNLGRLGGRNPGESQNGCTTKPDGSIECRRGYSYNMSQERHYTSGTGGVQPVDYNTGSLTQGTDRRAYNVESEPGLSPSVDSGANREGCRTLPDGGRECVRGRSESRLWGYGVNSAQAAPTFNADGSLNVLGGSESLLNAHHNEDLSQVRTGSGATGSNGCTLLPDGRQQCRRGYSSSMTQEREVYGNGGSGLGSNSRLVSSQGGVGGLQTVRHSSSSYSSSQTHSGVQVPVQNSRYVSAGGSRDGGALVGANGLEVHNEEYRKSTNGARNANLQSGCAMSLGHGAPCNAQQTSSYSTYGATGFRTGTLEV